MQDFFQTKTVRTTIVIMMMATTAKTIQIQYMHLPADFWSSYASMMFYSASIALSFAS